MYCLFYISFVGTGVLQCEVAVWCPHSKPLFQHVEAFIKEAEGVVSDLEKLRQQLTRFHAGVRVSSVEEALSFNREMFDTTKDLTHKVLEAGLFPLFSASDTMVRTESKKNLQWRTLPRGL